MRCTVIAATLALAVCHSTHAAAGDDPISTAAEALLGGLVQEEDVTLVFGYMREALSAAIEGREPPVPEKLTQRAEAIGEEAKRRGAVAARVLLDAIERSVREIFKEPPRLQPSAPLPQSGPLQRTGY
jgi:hypothetical protein